MKSHNKTSPLLQLKSQKRNLNSQLIDLKRQIASEEGSERKKRGILKQINEIEFQITDIDESIKQERKDLIKQYTLEKPNTMIPRTPTKQNPIDTGVRQPTEKNVDPDIIEKDLTIPTTISIPISEPFSADLPIREEISSTPIIATASEKSTGTIPKLKRSNRILNFQELDSLQTKPPISHPSITDPFEFPKQNPPQQKLTLPKSNTEQFLTNDPFALPRQKQISSFQKPNTENVLQENTLFIPPETRNLATQDSFEFYEQARNEASNWQAFAPLPQFNPQNTKQTSKQNILSTVFEDEKSRERQKSNIQSNIANLSRPQILRINKNDNTSITKNPLREENIIFNRPPNPSNKISDIRLISQQQQYFDTDTKNPNETFIIKEYLHQPQNQDWQFDSMQDALHQNTFQSQFTQNRNPLTETQIPFQGDQFQNIDENIAMNNAQIEPNMVNNNNHPINQPNTTSPRTTFLRRLKSIPIFRGESYNELRDFVDIADTLYVTILNKSEEIEFYHQLILQIRGEARNAIQNLEETKWQTIREKLRDYFSYLINKDIINSKLENLRQEKNESLNTFAERTRKLLRDKNNMYMGLSEDQKTEHNRFARRAFTKGIANPKLRSRLQIRGANSLEDAIAYSIEAETDLMQEISNRELICTYCRLTGHREKDCIKKDQNSGNLNNLISALQALNTNNTNRGLEQNRQRRFNNILYRNDRPITRSSSYSSNLNRNWNDIDRLYADRNWSNTDRSYSDRNWNNRDRLYSDRNWNNLNRNWNNSNRNWRDSYNRNNPNYPRYQNNNNNNDSSDTNRNDQQQNLNQNPIRRNENRNNTLSFPIRNFYFDSNSEDNSDVSCETIESSSEN